MINQMLSEYIPLPDVYKRAREVNGNKEIESRKALITAIRAEEGIRCYSSEIVTFESFYCWVFQRERTKLVQKPCSFGMKDFPIGHDEILARERHAYDIAYSFSERPHDAEVIRGFSEIFVFTDIEKTEDGSSELSKVRIGPEIILELSDDWRSLLFQSIEPADFEVKPHSRYWRNSRLRIVTAKNVVCLRSDVDSYFPYSIANPTRGKRGRPSHKAIVFDYLNTKYSESCSLPRTTEITNEMLDSLAQCGDDGPSRSTCMKFVKEWREAKFGKES